MPLTIKKDLGSGSAPVVSNCLATDIVGNFVFISADKVGNLLQVSTVDISNLGNMPAVGVITSKSSSTVCTVQFSGIVEKVFSGLAPNERYYIGTDGRLTATPPEPPAGQSYYIQYAGIAVASDALRLDLQKVPIKRSN